MADRLKAYAEWIVANEDKQGTPDFEQVRKAYVELRFAEFQKERAQNFTPPASQSPTAAYSQVGRLPISQQTESSQTVSRVGLPILGAMAMPGLLPVAPWIAEAVGGAVGSFFGSTVAGAPANEILSDVLLGATPFRAGGGLKGVVQNAAVGYTSGTLADLLASGEFHGISTQGTLGAAVPTATGIVGGVGRLITKGRKIAEDIFNQRESNALLSEALPNDPGILNLESSVFKDGLSMMLKETMANGTVGIANAIQRQFPNIPDTTLLTGKLAKEIGVLEEARKKATQLEQQAAKMEAGLREAREIGQSVRPEQVRAATEASLQAASARLVANSGLESLFGATIPRLEDIATGARMKSVANIVEKADKSVRNSLEELYDVAGIGENDVVATFKDVKAYMNYASRKGQPLEGDTIKKKVNELVQKAFDPKTGTITYENFKDLRQRIAKQLADNGEFASNANRIASEVYEIVTKGSGKTMRRTDPVKYKKWMDAQAFAAENFATREAGVVDALRSGDANRLLSLILEEGAGPALNQIDDYARLIGKKDPAGAVEFKKEINRIIRDGIIDKAADRKIGTIDPGKLAQSLKELKTKKFNIADIGFDDADVVSAMSTLSQGKDARGWPIERFQQFVDEAAKMGAKPAAAKMLYGRELRDYAVKNGLSAARKRMSFQMRKTRNARVKANDAYAEFLKLEADPLIKLMDDTNLRLSPDFLQNSTYVDKILTLQPEGVRAVMDTLRSSGRGADADLLTVAATAKMFRDVLDGPADALSINRAALEKLFTDEASKVQRNSLRQMLGDKQYQLLYDNLIIPLNKFYQSTDAVERGMRDVLPLSPFTRVGEGNLRVIVALQSLVRLYRQGKYNTLFHAVVNPKYANRAKAAGYVLENIQDPVTKAALLSYAAMDETYAQGQQQPQ